MYYIILMIIILLIYYYVNEIQYIIINYINGNVTYKLLYII